MNIFRFWGCISASSPTAGRSITGVVKPKQSHCRHLQPSYPIGKAPHASLTHLLPDLDGEIYLKTPSLADVNGDGAVNILDLVMVANGFGKSTPDPNGDGVVNILDLVFVAQQFSQ